MNIKTKIVTALTLAVLVVPGISLAQTMSVAQLQAEIQSLTAQLTQLEAQLAAAGGSTTAWCYTFNNNLSIGMSGSAVTALQTAIQKDGESVTVNGTFDDQTAASVTTFQQKYQNAILAPYGLSNGTGYAGKGTRAELNSLFGCGTGSTPIIPTPTPTPITPVTPSASSIQITSPTAGQTFTYGGTMNIQWTPASVGVAEIIFTPVNGGSPYQVYGLKVDGNPTSYSGSYSASLAGIPAGNYYVEVYSALDSIGNGTGVMGQSGIITITSAVTATTSLQINGSNGPLTVLSGAPLNLVWTSSGVISACTISVNTVGAGPFTVAQGFSGNTTVNAPTVTMPTQYAYAAYCPISDRSSVISQVMVTVTPAQQMPVINNINPGHGGVGATITISGTNLSNAFNVGFYDANNNSVASVVPSSASAGSVTFTISNTFAANVAPGTYQVEVQTPPCSTPAGCISNKLSFTLDAPVVQAPVINSFSVGAGPTFSLSAYNYNTITFQAQCGSFVAVVQPQNGSPTLYPTGSASICNAPQTYSSSSFNETSSMAPQMINVPLSLYNAQGVVDGSITMVGSPAGSNNSGSATLTVNVCNSAGVCVQQTASFPIYAKG